jgi:hypothetical protein
MVCVCWCVDVTVSCPQRPPPYFRQHCKNAAPLGGRLLSSHGFSGSLSFCSLLLLSLCTFSLFISANTVKTPPLGGRLLSSHEYSGSLYFCSLLLLSLCSFSFYFSANTVKTPGALIPAPNGSYLILQPPLQSHLQVARETPQRLHRM